MYGTMRKGARTMTPSKEGVEKIREKFFDEMSKKEGYLFSLPSVQQKQRLWKIVEEAISQAKEEGKQEVLKERENSMAWCSCGDSLERIDDEKGLFYPENAKYYCFGCDKYYKLVPIDQEQP